MDQERKKKLAVEQQRLSNQETFLEQQRKQLQQLNQFNQIEQQQQKQEQQRLMKQQQDQQRKQNEQVCLIPVRKYFEISAVPAVHS